MAKKNDDTKKTDSSVAATPADNPVEEQARSRFAFVWMSGN